MAQDISTYGGMAGARRRLMSLDDPNYVSNETSRQFDAMRPEYDDAQSALMARLSKAGLFSSSPVRSTNARFTNRFMSNISGQVIDRKNQQEQFWGGQYNSMREAFLGRRFQASENEKMRAYRREEERRRRKSSSRAGWMKLLGTGLGVAASFIPGVGPIAGPAVAGAFNTYGGGFDDGGQYDSNYQWDSNPGLN